MQTAYTYLALSAVLLAVLWVPYIAARVVVWGVPTFLLNYPPGYPATEPEPPLWARRAHRAHLNMVETFPAFCGVIVAAGALAGSDASTAVSVGSLAQVFFYSRIAYAVVYILGIPAVRTPTFLVGWGAIVAIAATILI